jgi:hypothetical protein
MDEKQLREWLRENLVVTAEDADRFSRDNDVYVGICFKDETKPFTRELVRIPDL